MLANDLKLQTSVPIYIKPWKYGGIITPINESIELPEMLKIPYMGCSSDEPGAIPALSSGGASALVLADDGIGYKIKSNDPFFEIRHLVATSEKTDISGTKIIRDEYLKIKIPENSSIHRYYTKKEIEVKDFLKTFYELQETHNISPIECSEFHNSGKPFGLRTKEEIENTIEVETKIRE